ncbi:UNVERIFIED_CONTAM: hypothetical protein PYX00_008983 [Menopon gallinae]|uniref:RING-type E3 ubiquitin transferase (cysteine targeting) n=1 Tax=Menopon gallinae TaxID=328185 RepID=A0AAW2H9J6_9NEOP
MAEKNKVKVFVPRITQLDANEFENEIHSLLKSNVLDIGKFLQPGFFNNVKPEIELCIKLLVFKYSLLQTNSTFGQQLLNIQYLEKISRRKAVLFAVLNYIIPYMKNKYDNAVLKWNNENSNNLKKLVDKLEVTVKICQFLNLMVFLKEGTYPKLVDRLLGIKMIPKTKLNRNVGYSYMTRELLWHGFMEFFMFVAPLINYQYLKRKIHNVFSIKQNKNTVAESVVYQLGSVCSICKELPIYPCRISMYCGHIACYYCVKSNSLADHDFACPSCGSKSTANDNLQFLTH